MAATDARDMQEALPGSPPPADPPRPSDVPPDDALDWARAQGLSAEDDLSYLSEFAHVTLARVLIAHDKSGHDDRSIHQAMRLLARLREAAHAGERTGSAIDILVVQALAHNAQGNICRTLVPLERALALAEPEGYVRTFVDEGESMRVTP